MPEGWEYSATYLAHNIHIPADVLQTGLSLSPGDMIGGFYLNDGVERCAGAGLWNGEHLLITAYGDDPDTPEKEGFEPSESLQWRLFPGQSGTSVSLTATYDTGMPHSDGTFHVMGLSLISALALDGTVNINDLSTDFDPLRIYPNPSNGRFYIEGLNVDAQIRIFDMNGKVVWSGTGQNTLVNADAMNPGLYLMESINSGQIHREKIIIRKCFDWGFLTTSRSSTMATNGPAGGKGPVLFSNVSSELQNKSMRSV